MKLLLTLLSILFFVPGHVNYYQVVYTVPLSKDILKTDDQYVYKGDSIDVIYSFWGDGGIMAFMVLNKSKSPVYIDWTKSAYADHNTTSNYYPVYRAANNISPAEEFYKTPGNWYKLFTPYILSGYEGAENSLIEEPVTLLPPKTYLFRAYYKILPNTPLSVKKLRPTNIPYISGMRESFPGWVMDGDSTNTALVFGNTLTYAANKDFTNAKHINNQFYVWHVLTFEDEYFEGYDAANNSVDCGYHSDKRYFISHVKLTDID